LQNCYFGRTAEASGWWNDFRKICQLCLGLFGVVSESSGPKKPPRIRWSIHPHGMGQIWGNGTAPWNVYGECGHAKTAEPIELPFGMVNAWGEPKELCIRWTCTLAPPVKYGWTCAAAMSGPATNGGDAACYHITLGSLVWKYASYIFTVQLKMSVRAVGAIWPIRLNDLTTSCLQRDLPPLSAALISLKE